MDWMKYIFLVLIAGVINSCGLSTSTTSKSSFKVRMHGIYSPPPGAVGDSAPRSQTYLFNGLTLTKSDGTAVELYEDDPKTLKIIDRGQVVYHHEDMSEYDAVVFSKALVKFDSSVVVTSKNGVESVVALSSGDLQLDESFTVVKAKEQVLTIKIAWGDTVTANADGTETVTPPVFTLKYEDGD